MLFSSGTFDVVEPNRPDPELPIRLNLSPDKARTTARLLLIIPGLAILLLPAALATFLLAHADMSALGPHDGFTMTALALQPILWLGLAATAGLSILPRLKRKRLVTVAAEQVSAIETGLTGTRAWQLPVRSYRGIAHHIRATAGVVTHEIILVHDHPERSILLHTAPMVHQSSLDHFTTQLRLPLIAAREVYRIYQLTPAGMAAGLRRTSGSRQAQPGLLQPVGDLALDGRAV